MKQKLPEGIPQPPEGYIYYGRGPISQPNYVYDQDLAGTDGPGGIYPQWEIGGWGGGDKESHYAIRAGTELARLNGLEGDGWQKVSEVGWPKVSDYPVWVWHPKCGMGWSKSTDFGAPITTNLKPFGIKCLNHMEDYKITHWQRCPITKPKPPVEQTSEAQTRIEAAERKLEEAKRELEQARKAL